jgi:peptidoglycan hydrolase CwlO-like protein
MSKSITKKELEKLQEQNKTKTAIIHDLGVLQTQIHTLNHYYTEVMMQINEGKKEMEEKYGKVEIDLSNGKYKEME